MRPDLVLVLGSNRNSALPEELFELGFTAIVRESMQDVLREMRSEQFAALLVDRANTSCDALELILNVRDIDSGIPVLVLGRSEGGAAEGFVRADQATVIVDTVDEIRTGLAEMVHSGKPSHGEEGVRE